MFNWVIQCLYEDEQIKNFIQLIKSDLYTKHVGQPCFHLVGELKSNATKLMLFLFGEIHLTITNQNRVTINKSNQLVQSNFENPANKLIFLQPQINVQHLVKDSFCKYHTSNALDSIVQEKSFNSEQNKKRAIMVLIL